MSVYDILTDIKANNPANEHERRMIHKVPDAKVVDRREYILGKVKGRTVLDLGCAGTNGQCEFFKKIAVESFKAYGIDSVENEITSALPNIHIRDIESDSLPTIEGVELVVAGEVLEHLSWPGQLLQQVRKQYPSAQLLITVPNAFSKNGLNHMVKGVECVNVDHVAWYSWRTLKTLVERFGYTVDEFSYYNGSPRFAEGIIFLCSGDGDGSHGSSGTQEAQVAS